MPSRVAEVFRVFRIPTQDRRRALNKPFGKLSANAVYIRRGSSTDIAKPDEIAKMGARTDERHPRLRLMWRVARSAVFQIILSIKNDSGAGSARAPRLSVSIPGPFGEANYGLDGERNYGLPRLPQSRDSGFRSYGSDSSIVIVAGDELDVTAVEYKAVPGKMPSSLSIQYRLSAEGFEPVKDVLTMDL